MNLIAFVLNKKQKCQRKDTLMVTNVTNAEEKL